MAYTVRLNETQFGHLAMPQVSLDIDEKTEDAIEQLMKDFDVKTRSAAIRRAIALARVGAENSSNHAMTLIDKNGDKVKVLLNK